MCLLCKNCIDAIKTRGEPIYVGPLVSDMDDEENLVCEWCAEPDTLYDCIF